MASTTSTPELLVKILREGGCLPFRGTEFAAGYDLYAAGPEPQVIKKRGSGVIGTAIAIALPPGTYGRIAGRSSLAMMHGIHVGGGVIDQDYRGEVMVLLYNLSDTDFVIQPGDRIAQLIIQYIATPPVQMVDDLPTSVRDTKGFGSTGR